MKCKHCNAVIPDDSNFCEYCGAKVKTRKLPWWGILLIVLGVAVVSFLIGQYSHGNDHSGETAEEPVEEVVEEVPAAPAGYVDLGLSVYWKETNEWNGSDDHGFYTYDDAKSRFGSSLPTLEQWYELILKCTWEWTGDGHRVTGLNGNSIFLPAEGTRNCDGQVAYVGECGYYWSSVPDIPDYACYLDFNSSGVGHGDWEYVCISLSVRLVQSK